MRRNVEPRLVVVVSGPSGAGKSTLCERFVDLHPTAALIVTTTTRPPRPNERHGEDYYFVTRDEFQKGIDADEFLEWAEVHDNFYGSPRREVERTLDDGKDVILEIDVQGGLSVKKRMADAVLVFVCPSDLSLLRQRLVGRNTDAPDIIEKRLRNARNELSKLSEYNYIVFNDDRLDAAVTALDRIVEAERHAVARYDTRRLFNPELL